MLKLKLAKTFPKAGAEETKKTSFFFSNGRYMKAAIVHGFKQQVILDSVEKMNESNLHKLFVELNSTAKESKAACIIIRAYAMFFAFNHDCGFSLFSKEGKLKSQTPNNQVFGTFSGRQSYEAYITTGVIQVEKGDTIILYNGNFDQIVQNPNFYKIVCSKEFEKKINALVEQDKERKEQGILIFTLD